MERLLSIPTSIYALYIVNCQRLKASQGCVSADWILRPLRLKEKSIRSDLINHRQFLLLQGLSMRGQEPLYSALSSQSLSTPKFLSFHFFLFFWWKSEKGDIFNMDTLGRGTKRLGCGVPSSPPNKNQDVWVVVPLVIWTDSLLLWALSIMGY